MLLILCGAIYTVRSSHIVGGELYYDCLGNNEYRITLKLYRDCNCAGANCAPYGNPEWVTIFNASGDVVVQVAMYFPGADTLQPGSINSCTIQGVCVEEAFYTANTTLPPIAGGYDILYQRCCRTTALLNLAEVAGSTQGATYVIHIPDSGLATCNSSPRFNSLPTMYWGVDTALSIDYSATDPNGDSLVYSLCDPCSGASATCPDPAPNGGGEACSTAPAPPPYDAAAYNNPYNALNFTNSPSNNNDLTINAATGLLTGIPNTIGFFDITVCVGEYRHGQFLGTMRRDYQFYIGQCNPSATGIAPSLLLPSTNFKLYPNPTANTFIIETTATGWQQLQVFNITGQLLLTENIEYSKTTIDASSLPAGIYIVSLKSSTGLANEKLVIER